MTSITNSAAPATGSGSAGVNDSVIGDANGTSINVNPTMNDGNSNSANSSEIGGTMTPNKIELEYKRVATERSGWQRFYQVIDPEFTN